MILHDVKPTAAQGATPASRDAPIPVGRRHRALCDIELLVHDDDAMGIKTKVLSAGSVFQPWAPLDHWRGIQVPITLGDQAEEFDWGVSSFEGHFIKWDDFLSHCQLSEPGTEDSAS